MSVEEVMNKDLIIEALEALVEKKEAEINELAKESNYYFTLCTALVDHIGNEGGRKAILKATASLSADHKQKLQGYINDNFAL